MRPPTRPSKRKKHVANIIYRIQYRTVARGPFHRLLSLTSGLRTSRVHKTFEFLGHRQPEWAAGSGVARLPAVTTVVGASGACFMPLGPSGSSLQEPCLSARCLTSSSSAIAKYRRVACFQGDRQLGDVNRGVVLGVGSTERCQGEVIGNKVARSLFKLWSAQCDLSSES